MSLAGDVIHRLIATLLRIVLAISGLVIFFVVMIFGAVLAIAVTIWALLSGRRVQPINFRWRGPLGAGARARQQSKRPAPAADVVDVEVREVEPVNLSSDQTPQPPDRSKQ